MPAKKQVTREMILAAAVELLREGGSGEVQVKALAHKLNCSTQPIYLSFDSMEALHRALSCEAIEVFLQDISCNGGGEASLYGMEYIRFAAEEKHLFQFLFMRRNAFVQLRQALTPIMNSAISRLMDRYGLDYDEAHYFHDQLWMHTHGIASMVATDFCQWDMDKVERMVEECHALLSRKYTGAHQL